MQSLLTASRICILSGWMAVAAAAAQVGRHAEDPPGPPVLHREVPNDPPLSRPPRPAGRGGERVGPVVLGPFVSIQVNVDEFGNNIWGDAANEPSIAIDPTNPDRIVIGWRQFDSVESDFRQAGWGHSHDGGAISHFVNGSNIVRKGAVDVVLQDKKHRDYWIDTCFRRFCGECR